MNARAFALFLFIVLSLWALMHTYVFWRASSIPWVERHVSRPVLIGAAITLWLSYVLARWATKHFPAAWPLEFFGANWMGVLFLVLAALLVVEVITLGGWVFQTSAPVWRGWAVIVAGLLSVVALVQGLRPPVVMEYEVPMPGLPKERDGTTLVAISDVHLGTLIGTRWMGRLVEQINGLRPELVVVVGDLVDSHIDHAEVVLPVLQRLRAPLGVYAVTGNHEFYAQVDDCVRLMEAAGYTVLRDRSVVVVPGLVVAGVDDLTARRQFGLGNEAVRKALANRAAGATLLLSHTPWQAAAAAAGGAGLMLSGHTHAGQIWPFSYLVSRQYPIWRGRYEVNGMTAIVCRGTGTWGPRMRLWRPSELLFIRLRATNRPA
jgi:predicted MPP superfamily phosphohydrolase